MRPSRLHIERREARGSTALLIADERVPVVHFALTLRQGLGCDPAGRRGLGSLLLELMLRGTRQHPRADFAAQLERLGSRVHVHSGFERTTVTGMSLSRYLQATLELLGEALSEPALAESEFQPLRVELIEGLRCQREDDETLAALFMRQAIYHGHVMAHPPEGVTADLQALSLADVREAHGKRFLQEELLWGLAGDGADEEAVALLASISERLPRGFRPPLRGARLAPRDRLTICVVDKPERTQAQLRVTMLGLPGDDENALALGVGVTAFGGTFTSSLSREIRDKRGWSYVAGASFNRYRSLAAPVVLATAPAIETAVDCLEVELEMLEALRSRGPESDAIEFARSYLLNRHRFDVATAADLLDPVLCHELLGLDAQQMFLVPKQLRVLDVTRVQEVMMQILRRGAPLVVMVATASRVVCELGKRFPGADIQVVDYLEGL